MEARVHRSPSVSVVGWKDFYMAAIFEDDSTKIPQRIAEAERALAVREAELCCVDGNQEREQQAMANAMYFLRLLRKIEKIEALASASYESATEPVGPSLDPAEWA
jgi:hypothetical protein